MLLQAITLMWADFFMNDITNQPQDEDKQEQQLTPEQLQELEQTEKCQDLMNDGFKELQASINSLDSVFKDEQDAIFDDAQEAQAKANVNNALNSATESAQDSGIEAQDNHQSVSTQQNNQDVGSLQENSSAQSMPDTAQAKVYKDIDVDDITLIADEDLADLEQLPLNNEGFRIKRVDIYNWSSFNNNVKSVYFGGQNVLMTGDNGAGKSSLIDALTVLLYDVQKIVFNQAAGAEKGERNLASYVLGLYKNDNSIGIKKSYGLRTDQQSVLSIIMAPFYNESLNETVVLIQCFSINRSKSTPDRHYYIGTRDFNLQNDVLPVKDVRELGAKLRSLGCVKLDSYREYSSKMQDLFGIRRTKVLDLFYKTISMKSISNISDFVRSQMLEDFSGDNLVEDLIERFDNLSEAYNAVETAKKQVEALAPIVELGENYDAIGSRQQFIENCRETVSPYLYKQKAAKLHERLVFREERLKQVKQEQEAQLANLERCRKELDSAKVELSAQGGGQLEKKKEQIANVEKERQRIFANFTHHSQFMQNLGLPPIETEQAFNNLDKKLVSMQDELKKNQETYEDNQTKASIDLEKLLTREGEINQELYSLRLRKNNIPASHINVRNRICDFVGCNESDLPFVGELIKLKDSEKSVWESAIERVLHNFAISLLVPEDLYASVVHYVNTNNLGMRLVFYRIREREMRGGGSLSSAFGSHISSVQKIGSNSLVRKLEFKQEPRFQSFIRQNLENNFNYVCTESEYEFRAEREALMPSGLSKKGGRNEKDDRRRDGSRDFVLGWTNEDKIASLNQELVRLRIDIDAIRNNIRVLKDGVTVVRNKIVYINRIKEITSFSSIDYQSYDVRLDKLRAELVELEHTSDIIASINKRIKELEGEVRLYESQRSTYDQEFGKLQGEISKLQGEYELALSNSVVADNISEELKAELDRVITEAMRVLRATQLTLENIDKVLVESSSKLDKRLKDLRIEREELGQKLINLQTSFTKDHVVISRNLDTRAECWVDFKTLYEKLKLDDLPKYLDAFRFKLSSDTLDQFATLNARFSADRRTILDRIDQINEIMFDVDYNPNHYIRMVAAESTDSDILKFRADLKACTRGNLNSFDHDESQNEGDETNSENQNTLSKIANFDFERAEAKFNEVKALIDRFKGITNGPEVDGPWRKKVTNVKLWFNFTASEHSRIDNSQVDYYEDSGGKSGGQKEKLAYTILASSLAYQYKSRQHYNQDRSFRFVIIDEAFGRGSPASVDYALTLFRKFNLQLLIATPMQKLDIIEKFVQHVAFVYRNEETNESTVVNYEINDYILKRKIKEQINKSYMLGTANQATIDVYTKHGLVTVNAAEANKLIASLDEKIQDSQSLYSGPVHNLPSETEDSSANKKKNSKQKGKGDESLEHAAQELKANKYVDEFEQLQQDSSLLNLARRQQQEEASKADAAKNLADNNTPPSATSRAAQAVAQAKNKLRLTTLTAEEMAAAQGQGLHTRNAQGEHMSIDEYKQRQDKERRELQKHDLDQALDKLDKLEQYPKADGMFESGEILDFDKPINFGSLASKNGFKPAQTSENSNSQELVVDTKQIQQENRILTNMVKRSVSPEAQKKYMAKSEEIKPTRSLDSLFVLNDDEDSEK